MNILRTRRNDRDSQHINPFPVLIALGIFLFAVPAAKANEEEWRASIKAVENNPGQVIKESEQALQASRKNGDKAAQVKALRVLSLAYLANADLASHYRSLDEGEPLARALGDQGAMCWFIRQDFQRNWFAQQYKAANTLFDEALALAQQYHLDTCLAMLYATKGVTSSATGRNSDGIEWLTKAYALFQSQGDHYYMAKTLADIATVFSAPGASPEDRDKALDFLKQALALTEPSYLRSSYEYNLRIGRLYLSRKEFAEAEHFLRTALHIAGRIDSPYLAASINFHLGEMLQQQKRFSDALDYFDTMLPLASASPDKALLIRGSLKRAEVLAELGRRTDSLNALATAAAAIPQPPSTVFDGLYRDSAAKVYASLAQYQDAYRQLQLLREADQRAAAAANTRLADELKVRFDVQLKETENALLRARQKEADFKRLTLTLALAMSLFLLIGVVWYLRKRAAVAKADAAYQKAIAAAESAANQAKGQFLANMSHELRSPLNAILGFARLMSRRTELPSDLTEDIGVILKSGEHLYTLINQVLDMSKIDAGHATLNETDFDLHDLLGELTDMFALAAVQKGLQLSADCQPDVPQYIHADAVKLRQILINLLNNAIKFTSSGSVVLRIERIGQTANCRLLFAVSDTGPGMTSDEMREVGEVFVQTRAGTLSKEGTGLGLALCRGLAHVMHAKLSLSTELGRGTTLSLDMPARIVNAANVVARTTDSSRSVIALAPGQQRYRILAVDDRVEGRQLLVRLLKPLGFDVREACDGQETIAIWEQWRPHLIWMDMRMPVLDGREATRRIKAAAGGEDTIIIALSASSFDTDRATILAAGCDDFLRKPFRETELFELMHKHLGVEFLYAESAAASVNSLPDAASLAALPAELQMQLKEALTQLDVNNVNHAIDAIRARDARLAEALAALARDFQYGRILELLSGI